ncbi:hypothetical protein Vadar_032146 [Vaccinium darrowii]|uniref:Uncharacterized protein n=1 Tax=Vaccinium darrowii TaxID=229202 RepID=A0ACB7Z7T8_9ERIC|nr:hypothetical protein Vadar_032146 [Vaccinium darrowii]
MVATRSTSSNKGHHQRQKKRRNQETDIGLVTSQLSDLPEELLEAIEERIVLYADKVRLRSVCVPWMYSTFPKLPHQKLHQSPCLLLPYSTSNNSVDTACGLFSPLDKKFYHLDLPELAGQGKLFRGSSHGWVVTSDDSSVCVLNPLTRAKLKLPPRSSFPIKEFHYGPGRKFLGKTAAHARKIILSTSPANDDYVAVAAYGRFDTLAYCRKGYTKWVHLDKSDRSLLGYVDDFIFFRGKLYALDHGDLLIWEIGGPQIMEKIWINGPFPESLQPYLVEYSGGLLMVERIFCLDNSDDPRKARTCGFKVYKFDVSCKSCVEVRDLGGDSLFLGKNLSSSISSGDFPGYKGNRIYFTDDNPYVYNEAESRGIKFDMGIYNLDDGLIESLHVPGYEDDAKNLCWPPPIWVLPKVK